MLKIGKTSIVAVVLGVLIAGVSGCTKKEGPMERTGREIDQGAEKTGQEIEKAIKKTSEKHENSAK